VCGAAKKVVIKLKFKCEATPTNIFKATTIRKKRKKTTHKYFLTYIDPK